MSWELAEYLHRCAWCGKFVSDMEAFTDVMPGGCRGHDWCEPYCNAACADKAFAKHHRTEGCYCEV